MPVEFLPWDSSHFGFGVGKAQWSGFQEDLERIVEVARSKMLTLLYVFGSDRCELPGTIRSQCWGIYVSERIEFQKYVTRKQYEEQPSGFSVHELFPENCDMDRVAELAVHAGQRSRFLLDPNIPSPKGEELFRIWGLRSLRRELADIVFGVVDGQSYLVGFVSAKEVGSSARIILLAVDPAWRGKGIGTLLVRAVEKWTLDRKCQEILVATQADNKPACTFYSSRGFLEKDRQLVFHLWLASPTKG